MTEEEKRDYAKYYVPDGENGFSPQRNQAVIDNTIKKNDEYRKKRAQLYNEQIRERSNAIVSYLFSRKGAQGGNSVERYFGKKELSYLRGQRIIEEMALLQDQWYKKLKEIR